MSTDSDWKTRAHADDCGFYDGYFPTYDMEWAAAYWGYDQAMNELRTLDWYAEIERLRAENKELVDSITEYEALLARNMGIGPR